MAKKQSIGIVANTAFNIYNFRLPLIQALIKNGHKVVAIAPADDYVTLLKENQIDFIALKSLSRKGTNPINDLKLLLELKKIYQQEKLDVVLQFTIKPNIYGTLAAMLTNTKAICTVTGLGYTFLNKNITTRIAHQLYKRAFSYANVVLFQNADDLNLFVEKKLVDKSKTQVVPGSGIDIDKYSPEFCSKTNKQDDNIHFLMIARLLKDKGIYEYIAAANQILQQQKNIIFHLLGDIDTDNPTTIKKEELDNWINEGIIQYHGYTKDTRPFICHADCIVLPSYREGMPRVILEAMAMGKPSITTNAAGCKDAVIDGETGFICNAADANDLAKIMQKFILLDNTYKVHLGINARKRAEYNYSTIAVNQVYIDLIELADF